MIPMPLLGTSRRFLNLRRSFPQPLELEVSEERFGWEINHIKTFPGKIGTQTFSRKCQDKSGFTKFPSSTERIFGRAREVWKA